MTYKRILIFSEEPITQNIEFNDVKYFWNRSYVDEDSLPRFVNEFLYRTSTPKVKNDE